MLLATKLGCSVKIKSIQEELFLSICVGSLALKSPNMTETDGEKEMEHFSQITSF